MIELIPAIDIYDGKCVRLTKGDYNKQNVYSDSPIDIAKRIKAIGFRRLHLVDLDGARSKHIVNINILKGIADTTGFIIDFGGGIKTDEDIETAFENGASMVTVGSIAATNPELFSKWIDRYGPERIILGADVRNGMISTNGWEKDSNIKLLDFLEYYVKRGIKNVLCTEISKDGTLAGPAIQLYENIMAAYPEIHLIASGGVSCVEDIYNLNTAGIPAVVFGKAIYEGKIDLKELWDWQNG